MDDPGWGGCDSSFEGLAVVIEEEEEEGQMVVILKPEHIK